MSETQKTPELNTFKIRVYQAGNPNIPVLTGKLQAYDPLDAIHGYSNHLKAKQKPDQQEEPEVKDVLAALRDAQDNEALEQRVTQLETAVQLLTRITATLEIPKPHAWFNNPTQEEWTEMKPAKEPTDG